MSTAHRPTFHSARGANKSGNMAIPTNTKRALDVPSETKLHYREQPGILASSSSKEEVKRKLEVSDPVRAPKKVHEPPVAPLALGYEEISFPEDEDEIIPASDSGNCSDDEEEELLRELARIREERAEEEAKRRAEEDARNQALREEEIAAANPLLSSGGGTLLRRRWDDDTVFQGQAKSSNASKEKKFVNDAVRSEFHKKFLQKYIV